MLLVLGIDCLQGFRIIDKKFILLMRSSELIYRYTFYNDFWSGIAKHLGKPMSKGFFLNSKLNVRK